MKLCAFLKDALSEDNGHASFTRLQVFLTASSLTPPIGVGFLWVLYKHPDLTIQYLTTIVALIPLLLGIKAWQKGKEQDVDQPPKEGMS